MTDPTKSGIKSTELYVTLVAVISLLATYFNVPLDRDTIEGVVTSGFIIASAAATVWKYIDSRTKIKQAMILGAAKNPDLGNTLRGLTRPKSV